MDCTQLSKLTRSWQFHIDHIHRTHTVHGQMNILLSTLTSVASDLYNDALWLVVGYWTGENTNGPPTNRLMKLVNFVNLTSCSFGSWGPKRSKFSRNMWCDLPEAYVKYESILRYSFWIITNLIKHVSEESQWVFTSPSQAPSTPVPGYVDKTLPRHTAPTFVSWIVSNDSYFRVDDISVMMIIRYSTNILTSIKNGKTENT